MGLQRRSNKQPVNLSLSRVALRQAAQLKRELSRPSVSNVVEFLLAEAVKKQTTQAAA